MTRFRYTPQIEQVLEPGSEIDDALIRFLSERDRQIEDFVSRPHELVFHFPTPTAGDTRGPYRLPVACRIRRVLVSTLDDASANTTTADVKLDGTTITSTDLPASTSTVAEAFDEGGKADQILTCVLSAVGTGLGDTTVQVLFE